MSPSENSSDFWADEWRLPAGDFRKTGGALFDPAEAGVYFLAADMQSMEHLAWAHRHWLIAVNEMRAQADEERLFRVLDDKTYGQMVVLVDSGIYNLATEHAKRHEMTMDEALSMSPENIDGFAELFDRYVRIVGAVGDRVWGYIELDQGGRENKIKTRSKLEGMGLRPIPVYHPFNDGWDYFDYLAAHYDRICFGNVVNADRYTRLRLVATAWERRRAYPDLWIHLLGLTPNQWLYAFPINSGDSSSWLSAVRWSGYKPRSMGTTFGTLPKNYQYVLGGNPDSEIGYWKARGLSAWGAWVGQENWVHALAELEALGFDYKGRKHG